jgi:hypothetical protein
MAIIHLEKYSLQRAGTIGHAAYLPRKKTYALTPDEAEGEARRAPGVTLGARVGRRHRGEAQATSVCAPKRRRFSRCTTSADSGVRTLGSAGW